MKINESTAVYLSVLFLLLASLSAIYVLQIRTGSSVTERVVSYSLELIEKIGYVGIFVLMTLESALIPIPSEIVMTFSGFLASSGKMNLTLAVVAGTLGNLAGSIILYKIGSGPGLSLLSKYGKYILVSSSDIERANRLFSRYGAAIVLAGRMLPAVRTVISLPAGIAKMNELKFVLYTLLGSVPWNFMLAYTGYLLGENWSIVERYARTIDYIAVLAIILLVLIYIFYKRRSEGERKL